MLLIKLKLLQKNFPREFTQILFQIFSQKNAVIKTASLK